MRAFSLLGVLALAGVSCSTMQRFGEPAPGLSDGAWRISGFVGGIGESSEVSAVDDSTSSFGGDFGKVIGDSGEFGLRLTHTEFDDADADVVAAGPYLRYYFHPLFGLRPLLELAGGLAGLDYGPGDDSGWSLSAGAGLIWVLADRFAVEAVLRQTNGDFEDGSDTAVTELAVGVSLFW